MRLENHNVRVILNLVSIDGDSGGVSFLDKVVCMYLFVLSVVERHLTGVLPASQATYFHGADAVIANRLAA